MFWGLPERFENEIKSLAMESMKGEVNVISDPNRYMFTYIGCSILSSLFTMSFNKRI